MKEKEKQIIAEKESTLKNIKKLIDACYLTNEEIGWFRYVLNNVKKVKMPFSEKEYYFIEFYDDYRKERFEDFLESYKEEN